MPSQHARRRDEWLSASGTQGRLQSASTAVSCRPWPTPTPPHWPSRSSRLPDGVVFPGTVVTLTLETDEARAAVDAAPMPATTACSSCPRSRAACAHVGVIAQVENAGELPGGGSAAIVRGLQRARLRCGRGHRAVGPLGPGRAGARRPPQRRASRRWPASCASCSRRSPSCAGRRRLPEILRTISEPGALADAVTAWAEAVHRPQAHRPRGRRGRRPRRAGRWRGPRSYLAELQVTEQHPQRRHRGHGEAAARVPAAPAAGRHPQGAGRGRRRRRRRLPRQARRRSPLPDEGARPPSTRRSTGWSAPAARSPEHGWIRTWLDRVLRAAVGHAPPTTRSTSTAARERARRRPLRPRRREGPHRRVPGRAQAARRARASSRRRSSRPTRRRSAGRRRRRRHHHPRRASRRRQDQPRRVGRPGHGPQLRAGRARRRPRRGRDPRPPPHLRRLASPAASSGPSPRPGR